MVAQGAMFVFLLFLWGPRKQSSTCKMMGPHVNPVRTWHMPKASIEMFEEPMDAPLWQLVALSAGTGGSMLAVGSVAGGDSHVQSSWPEMILTCF